MNESYLRGLYHDSSASERELAMHYYHQLQSSSEGWGLCAADFTQRLHIDEPVRFFCLQVIEHHVRERHATTNEETSVKLRELVMSWMQEPFISGPVEKNFVKNKMAQLYAMVCVIDYPSRWGSFFSDLLTCVSSGNLAVIDLYLRVLLAIDTEVVDRDFIHTPEENQRNTLIKDTMREQCVSSLVESWYQIMVTFEQYNHEVTCLVMKVVGAYVSWIDINYIANERFSSLLLKYLQVEQLRESSCDCLTEIVSKGMDPLNKIELAETLTHTLKEMGVLMTTPSNDDDADFQSKLSKLVNGIGMSLVTSYNKLLKSNDKERALLALQAMENKSSYLVRYLNDEDDDVSLAVIPFSIGYVGVLKSVDIMSKLQSDFLKQLLLISINKMKYDESYNFVTEGEDEVMFMEYRKELKVLFDNIIQLHPDLVLETIQQLLVSTLSQLDTESFMNIEVSLRYFYMMGEVLPDKGSHFSGPAVSNSPWYIMMNSIITSRLSYYSHIAVKIQYFELVVRYDKYFSTQPDHISPVLESFLDERGLRNDHPVVRSRVSYLFLRFLKPLKNQIGGVAEQILKRIRDLLFVLPENDEGAYISSNDMLFMYEAAGILVAISNTSAEQRYLLMKQLIQPSLDKLALHYPKMREVEDATKLEELANYLYHLMSYISRTTKVFVNHQTTRQSGCLQCYAEALPVILNGLEVPVHKETLHSGVRQYLHRMIICLGDELLNYVPMAITLLLKDCQSQNIQEFIPLINQLIAKYKHRMGPFLQEVFMPIIHTILNCSTEPYDPRDEEAARDRQNLQKCYYLFISSLVNNDAVEVISSQGSTQLHEVLDSIVQGTMDFPDPSGQKVCFGILRKLVEFWGQSDTVTGFVDYMYKTIIPACFIVPSKSSFDLNDGHTFQALGEIAGILKSMYQKRGDEFLQYLVTTYLPSINLSQELTQAIQQADSKVLKSYLKVFFTQLRTMQ
ncbi:exportin-T-like isoform X2 [Dysidea avara]|uniref:exportin-T-like isoform X2 n=1 Tax=Dysidea avara TaxID=196820 RepID=UPI0033217733